jgi:signal peptidase I
MTGTSFSANAAVAQKKAVKMHSNAIFFISSPEKVVLISKRSLIIKIVKYWKRSWYMKIVFSRTLIVFLSMIFSAAIISAEDLSCVTKREVKTVRGNSLSPLVKPGSEVTILNDYYKCNKPMRGDLVIYDYKGNPVPVIKIIKAVEKAKFQSVKNGGHYNLYINNDLQKNSEGKPYFFDERQNNMLALYEKDYGGRVPENSVLLLGDRPEGTTDSTRFGLVSLSDLIGKAEVSSLPRTRLQAP